MWRILERMRTVTGMTTNRPAWATRHPLLEAYYDTEWGVPITTESGLFELLTYEVFVPGLSWLTLLEKRDGFRAAFEGFEVAAVASFDEDDLARLLSDGSIIRNRRKIEATLTNARAALALRESGGLPEAVWSVMPAETPAPLSEEEVPKESEESRALAALLRGHGFTMVGAVTMQSLLAAAGVIDLHVVGSPRRGTSGLYTRTGRRKRRPSLE